MPDPGLGDVHVDTALTDISIALFQDPGNFIWRRFAPVVGSPRQSNKYYEFTAGELQRSEARQRAPGTEAALRNYKLSTTSFYCPVRAVAHDISRQILANSDDALDPEADAAALLVQDMNIALEVELAATVFGASAWGTTYTGGTNFPVSSTTKWSDAASSPIEDLSNAAFTIESNTGRKPNTLLLGAEVWYKSLKHHPDIIARLPDNAPRMGSEAFLASVLGLDQVLISHAIRNTADEGATASYAHVFGDNAVIAYVAPSPGLRTPSAAYSFSWRGLIPGDIVTRRIDIPEKDAVPRIEVETAIDFKVTGSTLGVEFTDCS